MSKRTCTEPDCGEIHYARGRCAKHYHQWRGSTKLGPQVFPPLPDRFWSKVEKSEGCWEWRGRRNRNGYGCFDVKQVQTHAHRVAYELAVGPIPEGLQIDHLCRNRGCVNPIHLEPVTRMENHLRGRWATHQKEKTHCPHGHPYDEANTVWRRRINGHLWRKCRACLAASRRRYRARQRAARTAA